MASWVPILFFMWALFQLHFFGHSSSCSWNMTGTLSSFIWLIPEHDFNLKHILLKCSQNLGLIGKDFPCIHATTVKIIRHSLSCSWYITGTHLASSIFNFAGDVLVQLYHFLYTLQIIDMNKHFLYKATGFKPDWQWPTVTFSLISYLKLTKFC